MQNRLLQKYDVSLPRYTSYPTVPHWQTTPPTQAEWLERVSKRFAQDDALSLYIHLPFCENLCTYCGCNKRITKNHAVEAPYIDTLLQEWQLYREALGKAPHIRELHLGGGTPTFFAPEALERLVSGILATAKPNNGTQSYSFEAHPANTTREHVQVLKKLGFDRISIGVQDFNPAILQLIHRLQTTEQVYDLVRHSREAGYTSINFDLVFGLPRQSVEDILVNMDHVYRLRPERIAFYSYAHVPWVSPGQRAYSEADLPLGEAKRLLYETGKGLLQEMGYAEIGFDHFALPSDELYRAQEHGHLHRNFMGYTPHNTLLNLAIGASSIGDTWDAYAQNEKHIETYQQRVQQGELPLVKGHLLDAEEQAIRRTILDITCQQSTAFKPCDLRYPAITKAQPQLAAMEADGLLHLLDHTLVVTDAGRPYLRNICAAFDKHLQQAAASADKVFSRVV